MTRLAKTTPVDLEQIRAEQRKRRRSLALDRVLEGWARWNAGFQDATSGLSMLARWMDGRGHMVFGTSAVQDDPSALEVLVETAVAGMFATDPLLADVLRLEYAAGYWNVCERRGIRGYDPRNTTHLKNALCLEVSLRTYRGRLAKAKAIIQTALDERHNHD